MRPCFELEVYFLFKDYNAQNSWATTFITICKLQLLIPSIFTKKI